MLRLRVQVVELGGEEVGLVKEAGFKDETAVAVGFDVVDIGVARVGEKAAGLGAAYRVGHVADDGRADELYGLTEEEIGIVEGRG